MRMFPGEASWSRGAAGSSAASIPIRGGSGSHSIGSSSSAMEATVAASPTSASTASPR